MEEVQVEIDKAVTKWVQDRLAGFDADLKNTTGANLDCVHKSQGISLRAGNQRDSPAHHCDVTRQNLDSPSRRQPAAVHWNGVSHY